MEFLTLKNQKLQILSSNKEDSQSKVASTFTTMKTRMKMKKGVLEAPFFPFTNLFCPNLYLVHSENFYLK